MTNNFVSMSPLKREICFYSPPPDGQEPRYETEDSFLKGWRNYDHNPVPVDIHDARGHEEEFAMSSHGFALLRDLDAQHIDLAGGCLTCMDSPYMSVVKELVASNIPHVIEVIPFDVTVRDAGATGRSQKPVRKVHVDQSESGAYLRAEHELRHRPEVLKDIIDHRIRYRIINFWKPTSGPVSDHPIVMADSRTVSDEDLVSVQQVYPHYTGETLAVIYNAAQRYWYWSNMTVREAILLQIYDSDVKNVDGAKSKGARCAHASFNLSGSADESVLRQNIEIRLIVLSSA